MSDSVGKLVTKDGEKTLAALEERIAADADAALRYLARHAALDLAPMLGLGEAA